MEFITQPNANSSSEDHKGRLELCKDYFLEKTNFSDGNEDICADQILIYLHDLWSVIRLECSKQITNNLSQINPKCKNILIKRLLDDFFIDSKRSWQEIHGNIAGLISFLESLDSFQMNDLTIKCIDIINHVSTPIRDIAKNCLVRICCLSIEKSSFLVLIMNRIDTIIRSETPEDEISTLTLDGLLSCLVDILPLVITTIPSDPQNLINITDKISFRKLSDAMKSCMMHTASSVRQKAGQVVSTILKLLSSSANYKEQNESLEFVLEYIIFDILSKKQLSSWYSHEVCLLICDELIRDMLDKFLINGINQRLESNTNHLNLIVNLINLLQTLLVYLICHPRFEIRRMILQILPTIARGKIILESLQLINLNILDCSSSKILISPNSPSQDFNLAVNMIWISQLIKENRHLFELFGEYSANTDKSNFNSEDNWSLEVQGRLMEVEQRQVFHSSLKSIIFSTEKTNYSSNNFILDRVTLKRIFNYNNKNILTEIEYLLKFLSEFFQQLQDEIELIGNIIISMDFVEYFMLVQCFLLTYPSTDEFDLTVKAKFLLTEYHQRFTCLWVIILAFVQYSSPSHNDRRTKKGMIGKLNLETDFEYNQNQRPSISESILLCFLSLKEKSFNKNPCQLLDYSEIVTDIHGDLDISQIKLIPTLQDPATNPLIYSEFGAEINETLTSKSLTGFLSETDLTHLDSSSELFLEGFGESTLSPSRQSEKNVNTLKSPPKTIKHHESHYIGANLSPFSSSYNLKSPSLKSPNKLGMGSNMPVSTSSHTFSGMNRWNCEAISYLLHVYTRNLSSLSEKVDDPNKYFHEVSMLYFSGILSEWYISCLMDPIWLDNRKYARRCLLEALTPLTTYIEFIDNQTFELFSISVFSIFTIRVLSEVSQLISKNNLKSHDIKTVLSIINPLITLVEKLKPFPLENLRSSTIDLYSCTIIPSLDINRLLSNSFFFCKEALGNFDSRIDGLSALSTDSAVLISASNVSLSPQEPSEDEFSDWDEDEDEIVESDAFSTASTTLNKDIIFEALYNCKENIEKWEIQLNLPKDY